MFFSLCNRHHQTMSGHRIAAPWASYPRCFKISKQRENTHRHTHTLSYNLRQGCYGTRKENLVQVAGIHPAFKVLALGEPPTSQHPWLTEADVFFICIDSLITMYCFCCLYFTNLKKLLFICSIIQWRTMAKSWHTKSQRFRGREEHSCHGRCSHDTSGRLRARR